MPELLSRLERLAAERHTDQNTLLSEAIAAYLEREEAQTSRAQIDAAYADDPDDSDSTREETSLKASRRCLLRRTLAQE